MDWNIVLEYLLKGLGSAAATLIITFGSILFAKLKTKISEARLNTFIDKTVKAAEQLFPNLGTKTGKEKYKYVVEQVLAKFPKLENNEYLKNLIEGAVYAVSQQVKQAKQIETTSTEVSTTPTISSF
jgi:hypothetical protein